MKKGKLSESQTITMLNEGAAGMSVDELDASRPLVNDNTSSGETNHWNQRDNSGWQAMPCI